MRYSLDQLEVFSVTIAEGSFSAAARRLNCSQSTVSTAIANLETDLGVALFDRSTRVPTLTAAGRALLRRTENILERCLELEQHAGSLGDAVEAKLTLAIEVPYPLLTQPLLAFADRFPDVDLDIRHPRDGDVSTLVQAGVAQLAVGFAQPGYDRNLGFMQMGKLVMSHVVARNHPLAQLETVSFPELHRHRRLAFSAHSERLPTTEYLRASRHWRAESHLALLELTRAGLGWATLPRHLALHRIEAGELVELRLAAYPHTDWLVGVDLLWNQSHPMGPAGSWLRDTLSATKVSEIDSAGHPTTF